MRWMWSCAVVGLTVMTGCGSDAQPAAREGVSAHDVWARPTPPSVTTSAVYMVLESAADDKLLSVTVDQSIAARASMHETMTMGNQGDDMMSMQPLDAIDLPGGEDVKLEPGGLHIMLEDLASGLTDGEQFELTLRFANAAPLVVTVEVRDE
jgi:periplasmic copper chaperone A